MTISALHENSATIGTSEWSLPNNSATLTPITTDGHIEAVLDLSALAAGDRFRVRIYEKVRAADTQRKVQTIDYAGVQSDPNQKIPLGLMLHGWDVTLQKVAGTDRAIAWSIRAVT